MSVGTRIAYQDAATAAHAVLEALRPACLRIDVAGSVRRRVDAVGDLDLVAAPIPDADMFGRPIEGVPRWSELDGLERRAVDAGLLRPDGGGGRQRKYVVTAGAGVEVPMQLWRVPEPEYAVALLIRTGPATFSKRFVTQRCYGGLLRDDAVIRNNRLWLIGPGEGAVYAERVVKDRGEFVPAWVRPQATPDERSLFERARVSYCRPEDRA